MKKYLIFIFFFSLVAKLNGQTKCNCKALIDNLFMGEVSLFDKPNGKLIKKLSHNAYKEDYLVVTIIDESSDYFKVKIKYSLESKKEFKGWMKKVDHIGIYTRNYEPNEKLNLYSEPNSKSKIKSEVIGWSNKPYAIQKCDGKWVYIKFEQEGIVKEGWLEPEKQCANPYTTCN